MIIKEQKIIKDGSEIVLRCLGEDDAEVFLSGYKRLLGETRFLSSDPDEICFTLEQERELINRINSDKSRLLIAAFVDGRYAGNCVFAGKTSARKTAHRASLGIGIFQEFAGKGLGRIMLEKLLAEAKKAGYEQMELMAFSENKRARRLYEKLGFIECGRIPDAARFPDGTSFDEILMCKKL